MRIRYAEPSDAEQLSRFLGSDEVVSHAFSHGFHPEHAERLAAYWAEALGGPTAYLGISDGTTLRSVLHDYFAWATTTTVSRYHRSADDVPDGLRMPHWSWGGLQD